jgi:OOP family OmpA-OmpF porin
MKKKQYKPFRMALAPLGIAAACSAAQADDDRRFYLAPMFSYTFHDHDRGTGDGLGGELAIGKRLTRGLELELIGIYSRYGDKSGVFPASYGPQPSGSTLYGGGGGANIYLAPSSESFLKGLYLHLDVLYGEGTDMPGTVRDYHTTVFDAGLGYNWVLTHESLGPFASGIALRVEGLYRHDAHGEGDLGTGSLGNQHQYFQEGVVNIGLRIPLGRSEAPPAQPPEEQPTQVVPTEEPPAPAPEAAAPPPCEPPAPGQPVNLEGCKTGDTIVLRGVNFDFNKASLTVNARQLLDQVADALLARSDIKVEIDGHTDGKGSASYNQKLSERRAESVKQYLVGRGIDAGRMSTKGFGKSKPIADNSTDEGRELNRRVELKVTESGGGAAAPAAAAPAAAAEQAPVESTPPPAESAAPLPTDSSTAAEDAAPAEGAAPAESATPPADAGSGTPADAMPPDSASPSPEAAPANGSSEPAPGSESVAPPPAPGN